MSFIIYKGDTGALPVQVQLHKDARHLSECSKLA